MANLEEITPVDPSLNEGDGGIVEEGTNDGANDSNNEDSGRPNRGTGTAGPKRPGNGGNKDQYSLRGDESEGESPVEGDDEEDDSQSDDE